MIDLRSDTGSQPAADMRTGAQDEQQLSDTLRGSETTEFGAKPAELSGQNWPIPDWRHSEQRAGKAAAV
jgi:hypothetical protein